ncbi:helix-turn-helix transcriptional regulator [Lacibacterium aquatile]|uniref:Helix-turn-helix transcriptional regulator n=1 Tax=Lacibacterium aquatile TaxID=1168082 RepID=A0ABW5DP45_9PROT
MIGSVSSVLHAAAAGQASWLEAVESVSESMRAAGAALMVHHGTPMTKTVSIGASTIDPVFHQVYLDSFIDISPLRRFVQQGNVDRIFTGEEVLGRGYTDTDFYKGFLKPFSLGHQLVQIMTIDPGTSASLVFYRTAQQSGFEGADRDLFESLTGPLRNALDVHVRLSRAEQNAQASAQALDTQGLAVFLVNSALNVRQTNEMGEVLRRQFGLFKRSWLLSPKGFHFKQVLAEALVTGRPVDGLCRAEGNTVLVARIIPILGGAEPFATVLMRDPGAPKQRPWKAIQSFFDLSAAEVRILRALTDDEATGAEIAASLGISTNTLKSQRSSAYAKIGASSQAEMLRLLDGFSF